MTDTTTDVAIIMGSDSDLPIVEAIFPILESFGVNFTKNVMSAHRTPHEVMDLSEERNEPRVFINPEYKILDNESLSSFEEGCLSIPGFSEEIIRPNKIDLTWQDLNGEIHNDSPDGLLTICIQHEMDHLEGKLKVDYISPIKRDRIRKKLSK